MSDNHSGYLWLYKIADEYYVHGYSFSRILESAYFKKRKTVLIDGIYFPWKSNKLPEDCFIRVSFISWKQTEVYITKDSQNGRKEMEGESMEIRCIALDRETRCNWYWYGKDKSSLFSFLGADWNLYSAESGEFINKALGRYEKSVGLVISDKKRGRVEYTLDLDRMKQVNNSTKFERHVRCMVPAESVRHMLPSLPPKLFRKKSLKMQCKGTIQIKIISAKNFQPLLPVFVEIEKTFPPSERRTTTKVNIQKNSDNEAFWNEPFVLDCDTKFKSGHLSLKLKGDENKYLGCLELNLSDIMDGKIKNGYHYLTECKEKSQTIQRGEMNIAISFIKHEEDSQLVTIDFANLVQDIETKVKRVEIKEQDYEYQEELGKGTFGTVYRAMDPDRKLVAIKKFNILASDEDSKKIKDEILVTHRLSHPNCISYIGSTVTADNMIIVLEYANGGDLFTYIQNNSSNNHLDESGAAKVMKHLLQGLKYLHGIFIAHLDIKLENILYSSTTDQFKIADFGESIIFEDLKKQKPDNYLGGVRGTTAYMAPEILIQPSEYTETVDIWASGVVLYMLLTGYDPWGEDTEIAIILNSVDREVLIEMQISHQATDLMDKLMCPDRKSRISPTIALDHEFLKSA
jgi:hypothetical protein